jgi:hypothetical protein
MSFSEEQEAGFKRDGDDACFIMRACQWRMIDARKAEVKSPDA